MADVDELVVIEQSGSDPAPDADGSPMTGETLVQLLPWAGGGVTDVRPMPGEPGRFTFYLPGSYMWFDVTVDAHDRLVYQRLVNPGHDIRHRFRFPASRDGTRLPARHRDRTDPGT